MYQSLCKAQGQIHWRLLPLRSMMKAFMEGNAYVSGNPKAGMADSTPSADSVSKKAGGSLEVNAFNESKHFLKDAYW